MAQVTFVSAGTGAALNGTGTLSVPYPAGIQANDLLVVHSVIRNNDQLISSISAPNFISSYNENSSYPGFIFTESFSCLRKIATGTETGSLVLSFTNDGANTLKFARMYLFRNNLTSGVYQSYFIPITGSNLGGTTPAPPDPLLGTQTNTTNTVVFGDMWSPQTDALGICLVNVWDDNPQTAPTGTTGGTWTEATPEFTSTVGTDGSLGLFTIPLTQNQYVNGGSFSMGGGAADPWSARTFLILAQSPTPSYAQTDSFNQRGFYGV